MKKLLLTLVTIMFISCSSSNNQGWPFIEQKAFMDNCILSFNNNSNGQGNAEEYCECALEKTISEYPTPDDALKMDMDFVLKMAEECLNN